MGWYAIHITVLVAYILSSRYEVFVQEVLTKFEELLSDNRTYAIICSVTQRNIKSLFIKHNYMAHSLKDVS